MATSSIAQTPEYDLPQYGYLSFDPLTLKSLIKERLSKSGIFTEQVIEGSYIAQLIDIFAYTYNALIYYMNKTASEGSFVDTELAENLNRITKALGYNPIGRQTSVVAFKAKWLYYTTDNDYITTKILPRYSYVNVNGTTYALSRDMPFIITNTDKDGFLTDISNKGVLYQGFYEEYETITAEGMENEIVFLNPGTDVKIDHFTIDVYVKSGNKWQQWNPTTSLYLNNATDNVYEIRLNENNYYELKFGNDINGKRLSEGDLIKIFFINSNGTNHEIGAEALDDLTFVRFSSDIYDEIMDDIRGPMKSSVLSFASMKNLAIFNTMASTDYTELEDSESIKNNAPGIFRSQYRLVTDSDFSTYIKTNFSNLVHDVFVTNNWGYISEYLKYMHDIGIATPDSETNAITSHVLFADACNFNNVYISVVPKVSTDSSIMTPYLPTGLKTEILNSIQNEKVLTCEPVIIDPIYIAFGICYSPDMKSVNIDNMSNSALHIVMKSSSKTDSNTIKTLVCDEIRSYFNRINCKFGQKISISELNAAVLNVDGVDHVYTSDINDSTKKINGISLIRFNDVYRNDIELILHDHTLSSFQFPYLYDAASIENKVIVDNMNAYHTTVEY